MKKVYSLEDVEVGDWMSYVHKPEERYKILSVDEDGLRLRDNGEHHETTINHIRNAGIYIFSSEDSPPSLRSDAERISSLESRVRELERRLDRMREI